MRRMKETFFLAAGLVGVRGREKLRVFPFFWCWTVGMKEGESFLSLLLSLRKSKRDKVLPKRIKNKERRKQGSKERTKEVSGATKKSRRWGTWMLRGKWADYSPFPLFKIYLPPLHNLIF